MVEGPGGVGRLVGSGEEQLIGGIDVVLYAVDAVLHSEDACEGRCEISKKYRKSIIK